MKSSKPTSTSDLHIENYINIRKSSLEQKKTGGLFSGCQLGKILVFLFANKKSQATFIKNGESW